MKIKKIGLIVGIIILQYACSVVKMPITANYQTNKLLRPTDLQISDSIFANFQGLKNNDLSLFFEGEGYSLMIEKYDLDTTQKSFSKIENKFFKPQSKIQIEDLPKPNFVYTRTDTLTTDLIQYSTVYAITHPEKGILTFVFGSVNLINKKLEKEIVKSFYFDGINNKLFAPLTIDKIDFIGREIQLGPACHWASPHDIQCNPAEFNWSIHKSLMNAEICRDAQYLLMKNKKIGNVEQDELIDVIFEGKETKARKVKSKIMLPAMMIGGNNQLLIFYIAEEIRGKYVHCVLSYWDDLDPDKTLPPLLSEVLQIKK